VFVSVQLNASAVVRRTSEGRLSVLAACLDHWCSQTTALLASGVSLVVTLDMY
jgi:hypothetical protein